MCREGLLSRERVPGVELRRRGISGDDFRCRRVPGCPNGSYNVAKGRLGIGSYTTVSWEAGGGACVCVPSPAHSHQLQLDETNRRLICDPWLKRLMLWHLPAVPVLTNPIHR